MRRKADVELRVAGCSYWWCPHFNATAWGRAGTLTPRSRLTAWLAIGSQKHQAYTPNRTCVHEPILFQVEILRQVKFNGTMVSWLEVKRHPRPEANTSLRVASATGQGIQPALKAGGLHIFRSLYWGAVCRPPGCRARGATQPGSHGPGRDMPPLGLVQTQQPQATAVPISPMSSMTEHTTAAKPARGCKPKVLTARAQRHCVGIPIDTPRRWAVRPI